MFFRVVKWLMVLVFITVLFFFLANLFGHATKQDHPSTVVTAETQDAFADWVRVDEGVDRLERISAEPASGTRLILYRFDPALYQFHFANTTTKQTLSQWRRAEQALFVVNGVYFDEHEEPAGLLRVDDKNVNARRYDLDKSGLIVLDHPPRLLDTQHTDASVLGRFSMAAQSYPFFIRNGEEGIQKDSGFVARRTVFGIDERGLVYIGIVPDASVTLYQMMKLLEALPIHWQSAINLDGGPSTGFAANIRDTQELIESYTGVPNVLVVTKNP